MEQKLPLHTNFLTWFASLQWLNQYSLTSRKTNIPYGMTYENSDFMSTEYRIPQTAIKVKDFLRIGKPDDDLKILLYKPAIGRYVNYTGGPHHLVFRYKSVLIKNYTDFGPGLIHATNGEHILSPDNPYPSYVKSLMMSWKGPYHKNINRVGPSKVTLYDLRFFFEENTISFMDNYHKNISNASFEDHEGNSISKKEIEDEIGDITNLDIFSDPFITNTSDEFIYRSRFLS